MTRYESRFSNSTIGDSSNHFSHVQCLANGVLISRMKTLHDDLEPKQALLPALKICVTIGLTRKEIEKAGTTIRHAITKVMNKRK